MRKKMLMIGIAAVMMITLAGCFGNKTDQTKASLETGVEETASAEESQPLTENEKSASTENNPSGSTKTEKNENATSSEKQTDGDTGYSGGGSSSSTTKPDSTPSQDNNSVPFEPAVGPSSPSAPAGETTPSGGSGSSGESNSSGGNTAPTEGNQPEHVPDTGGEDAPIQLPFVPVN